MKFLPHLKVATSAINIRQQVQVSLSIRCGGMGLRRVTDHCAVAFISSWINSHRLISRIFLSLPFVDSDIFYKCTKLESNLIIAHWNILQWTQTIRSEIEKKNDVTLHMVQQILNSNLQTRLHEILMLN